MAEIETPFERRLDQVLQREITHPCAYHPAGRNHLMLNPQERREVVDRVLATLKEFGVTFSISEITR